MDLVTLVLACSLYADNSIPYAMIKMGPQNNPLIVTVDNETKSFKTIPAAIQYTQNQVALRKNPEIGLMQIPSQWLPEMGAHISDLFRPCKNLVVATQILEKLRLKCQSIAANNLTNIQACVLSLYKTKNLKNGLFYAYPIIQYAKLHPFNKLAEKARDPGMLAATEKPTEPIRSKETLIGSEHSTDFPS